MTTLRWITAARVELVPGSLLCRVLKKITYPKILVQTDGAKIRRFVKKMKRITNAALRTWSVHRTEHYYPALKGGSRHLPRPRGHYAERHEPVVGRQILWDSTSELLRGVKVRESESQTVVFRG